MTPIQKWLETCKETIHAALLEKLPLETTEPVHLHKAMRYSVLNGGKRLRSAFIYATAEAFGLEKTQLNDIAVVIECMHAFSLIHDDLPALDNDDLRRGQPTCHKVFGEATAILAGDALHSFAFRILSDVDPESVAPEIILAMIRILSHATGSQGMIGGESLDINMVNQDPSVEALEHMYHLKTGSLFSASLILAALACNCQDNTIIYHLAKFAENLGIAFQIQDDIIGIESNTQTLGKKQKADLALNKPVYPSLTTMKKAKSRRDALHALALEHLKQIPLDCERLEALADIVIARDH